MNTLKLIRKWKTDNATIGELYLNDVFQCYTLEDKERDIKIKNETAIPKGTYKVIMTLSDRFKRVLPLLVDVKNYEGVRIHWGNTNHDTEGCILVGTTKGKDFVGNSRTAFNKLFKNIEKLDNLTITIQ